MRAPSSYKSGTALVNAIMRERYGKDKFILTRSPAGYFYWRGEDDRASWLSSTYQYRVLPEDAADIVTEAAREINEMEPVASK